MRPGFIWIFLSVLLSAGAANAQSAEYQACVAGKKANVDFGQCGDAEIKRQETHLNAAWKQAYACFDGESMAAAKQSFLEEQRLWVKWKDASCGFYSDGQAFGREGQTLSYPACRAAVIQQRTQFLEKFGKECG